MNKDIHNKGPGCAISQRSIINTFLFRIIITMKLVIVLTLFFSLHASASVFSQTINLSVKNQSMEKVMQEIRTQSGYNFFFNSNLLKDSKLITAQIKNESLENALKIIFKGQHLDFEIKDKSIIVKPAVDLPSVNSVVTVQSRELKGNVTGADNGAPIAGITVNISGPNYTKTTATDANGNYILSSIPVGTYSITFSSVGYTTIKRSVIIKEKGDNVFNVLISEDVGQLDQIVVTAYGTSKVRDVTGSIVSLGAKDIQNAPMGATIQSLLQGKASGVNVAIQSASPTSPISVIIRGASSLTGNNQPLWVIDGVPDYSSSTSGSIDNTLYNLNLNDVESIDILKDASATALYGSRAANGVVIVTTKKGIVGMSPTIELTSRIGYQTQDFNGYQYMTSPDYIHFTEVAAKEGVMTLGGFDFWTEIFLDEGAFMNLNTSEYDRNDLKLNSDAYFGGNTNWMKEMTQNPWNQRYDLSLRGGTQNIAYFVSLNATDTEGIVKSGDSKLYGGRVNLEAKPRKGIKFGLNLNGSSRSTNNKDYMMSVLKKIRPDIPPYASDRSLFTRDPYTENPYTTLLNTNRGDGQTFNGTAFLEFNIQKDLIAKSAYTANYVNSQNLSYKRRGSEYNYDGTRDWNNNRVLTSVWENTLTLAKNFDKHDLLGLAGFSMEKNSIQNYAMNATNFPDDDVLNDFGSGANRGELRETYTANSLVSGFARLTYKYNDRYILSGTVRQDGSSRFGPDKRWGFFPSGAVAWLVSEEDFLRSGAISNVISYLKLRASIGITGSQNLGNYAWRTGVGSSRYNEMPALTPSSIGNPELQWEQTKMLDFGVDYGFWNDRIRGTFGIYEKLTDHLIYGRTLPPSSSFTSVSSNVASLKNNGIEFDFKIDALKREDFVLTLDLNGGRNINRLLKINGVTKYLDFPNSTTPYMRAEEGERTGQWFGFQTANRLFVTQEEIIALQSQTSNGSKQYYRTNLERPGDLIFIDQNNDGKIDNDDRTIIGSADPKLFGGFGTTAIYKGIRVNATFTYSYGNMRLWKQPMDDAGNIGNFNQSNLIAGESATLQSPYEAQIPRMTMYGYGSNGTYSDFWLYDASYIRLSALNFSYRIPSQYLTKFFIQGIDLNFQASNLFTITKYPGFDPQGNWSSSAIGTGMGVDNSSYPSAKTYNLGIKFTFK